MKKVDGAKRDSHGASRRSFLAATLAAGATAGAARGEATTAVSFPHSYLYCVPHKTGIWVRMQAECHGRLTDTASGREYEYVLGTVAKTGLTPLPDGTGRAPGYDYSVIFSKTHVYTKRPHASALFNNPSTQTAAEFGETGWELKEAPARPLTSAASVKEALQGGQLMTARSHFAAADGAWTWDVTYPVKWADCATDGTGFRVETGPVLLPRESFRGAKSEPGPDNFEWAHLDYNDFASARCLLEGPTALLADADYGPGRERVGLKAEALAAIQTALADLAEDLDPSLIDSLFKTNHFGAVETRSARHQLFALEQP